MSVLVLVPQVLFESTEQNRMVEAIELFQQICATPYLKNSAMILLLNKTDLLANKLKDPKNRISLVEGELNGESKQLWGDYDGPEVTGEEADEGKIVRSL